LGTITEVKKSITEQKEQTSKEKYFPKYNKVGSDNILKDSNIEINSYISAYIQDINIYIHSFSNSLTIIDLQNALKTGLTCKRYSITLKEYNNNTNVLCELYNNNLKTVKEIYQSITEGSFNIETLQIETGEEKSMRTFSPFTEIKPIKKPEKWTISHIWKAILSGQIYKGECRGNYTDDYAYDATVNFHEGRKLNLIYLAKEVIESPSGWWVSSKELSNGIIELSFNCHHFNNNTLYFDENCTLAEAEQREEQEQKELENYNNSLLSEVKTITESEIEENALYNIEFLEIDDNTNKYKKVNQLIKGSDLFYEGECWRKITDIVKHTIEDKTLYTISNFYNRPHFEDDERYINLGNWENIVTGKALKELLKEGKSFPMYRLSEHKTVESVIERLQSFITGRSFWGVCSKDIDYQEQLNKLMREIERI
jgi:hypothetical protein